MTTEQINDLSRVVVDSLFEVHQTLGPGLLENVYEKALAVELRSRGLEVRVQVEVPVFYKGIDLELFYRIDALVEDELVIELKSIQELQDVHFKQTLTYLRLAGKRLGLLVDFNVPRIRDGIRRVVNGL